MIRAVFFDLDETLIDAIKCHSFATRKAFEFFNLDYQAAKKKNPNYDGWGRRIIEILETRRNDLNVNESILPIKKLAQKREQLFLQCVQKNAKFYPGALQAIKNARKNADIVAITSSGTKKYINLCLDKFKFKKKIDFIVGEEDVQKGKPHPEIYSKAFSLLPKKLKIKKQECLVIEDSVNGVKAAKAAQLKVLFIPSNCFQNTIKADWQLSSLKDFNLTLL
ncbi:HAD family hydrolase [Patescibacteria group bacterium]